MRGARGGATSASPCVVTVVVIVVTVTFVLGGRSGRARGGPGSRWHLGTSRGVRAPPKALARRALGPRRFMALAWDPSPSAGLCGKIWRHCEIRRPEVALPVPRTTPTSAIMAAVSTATAAPHAHQHVSVNRPNPVSVGTIVWLASEIMFFAGLFAMYFTVRSVMPAEWAEQTAKLNVTFAAINTTVLVLSSVTCQMGVWAAERFQPARSGSLLQV